MYFRENDKPVENYSYPKRQQTLTVEKFTHNKLPLWSIALIVVGCIAVVLAIWWYLSKNRSHSKQQFGFRFY